MADKQLVSQYDGTHVKVGDRLVRVDKGAAVPAGADEEHVALLLERGMLAEGEPTAGFQDPGAEPPFPGRGAHQTDDSGDGPDDVDGDGPIPAKSATKDAWVAYAVSQRPEGTDEAEAQTAAEALTKEQLIDTYGRPAS